MRVLASADSQDGHQIHDFLDKNRIPHRYIALETEDGQALAARLHIASHQLPALVDNRGVPLRRPSLREVAQVAGLLRPLAQDDEGEILCDLAIVGAGPAGLAAAVNAASEGLKTVVLEAYAPGGQAASSNPCAGTVSWPSRAPTPSWKLRRKSPNSSAI